MSFKSNPPPTYAEVVLNKGARYEFNPIWLKWFVDLAAVLNSFTVGGNVFGDVTANTVNKVTITPPATGATLTLYNGKTFAVANTLSLAGTDGTTMTFPSTNATLARTDAANAFTGVQTLAAATATPANGSTAACLLLGTTAGFGIYYGSGAPTVSAAAGSLYIRTDNAGANLRLYSNTTGGTTWAAITSA